VKTYLASHYVGDYTSDKFGFKQQTDMSRDRPLVIVRIFTMIMIETTPRRPVFHIDLYAPNEIKISFHGSVFQ